MEFSSQCGVAHQSGNSRARKVSRVYAHMDRYVARHNRGSPLAIAVDTGKAKPPTTTILSRQSWLRLYSCAFAGGCSRESQGNRIWIRRVPSFPRSLSSRKRGAGIQGLWPCCYPHQERITADSVGTFRLTSTPVDSRSPLPRGQASRE